MKKNPYELWNFEHPEVGGPEEHFTAGEGGGSEEKHEDRNRGETILAA